MTHNIFQKFNIKQVSLLLTFLFISTFSNINYAQGTAAIGGNNYQPTYNGQLVKHKYYSLSYREDYEQAEWVYYALTPALINGTQGRTDNFRPDAKVSTKSASLDDYSGSGYDRGHLCPAGAMKINREAMSESFYLSNMAPQAPGFNRGAWKELESVVRTWAANDELIYVVSGGVLSKVEKYIGANKVAVPAYFYKVIYSPSRAQMIAFLMPNRKIAEELPQFVCSVDKIESLTGIDFFPQLEDGTENSLEAQSNASAWAFKAYTSGAKTSTSSSAATTQCAAITGSGNRCKRNAADGSKYCWQHGK